jgi:4-alpha-glucanotransferase
MITPTSPRLAFGLVLHQHQPVGNLAWVFEDVYQHCYVPLLGLFERHPSIQVNLHYSGSLLDWIIAEHPDYLDRLAALVQRGQVEMLTGGYYEPILPILPAHDQHSQITRLTSYLQQRLGATPEGLWLAERVWEPELPSVLARAGVQYTIVDDTHFIMAGLDANQVYGYYMTEDQGLPIAIFPDPKIMRDLIPWRPLQQVEQQLIQIHEEAHGEQRLIVLADDGEKFGSWPGTYDRLWTHGGMDRFMEMFERNSSWLETVKLSTYRRHHPPLGRIYLPTASYTEMMEWALPAKRSFQLGELRHELMAKGDTLTLSFLHGGSWRNFAVKYPESNNFQKKMLRVHGKIFEASPLLGPERAQAAWNQLWQGQCNCGYWHGAFGGIYIADIRSAIYQHLIRAESIADSALPSDEATITLTDFDCDGREELLIEAKLMNVYIAPYDGGSIFEWDWKMHPFNLIDTLARRPEAYHEILRTHKVQVIDPATKSDLAEEEEVDEWGVKLNESAKSIHDIVQAKEEGLERLLHYDPYRRTLLRDHIFSADTTLEDFRDNTYDELGDFAAGTYEQHVRGVGLSSLVVDLEREGVVKIGSGTNTLHIHKEMLIALDQPEIHVTYRLKNTGDRQITARFGVAGNWGMIGGHNESAWCDIDGKRSSLDHPTEESPVTTVSLVNSDVNVRVTQQPSQSTTLWCFPVEALSNSEAGFERSYQCTATLFHWPLDLAPGATWRVELMLALG